jgi:polyisoprenyl-phosphate glycosyltransferase
MGPAYRDVVLSLVIPIYNEEEVIDNLHAAIVNVMEDIGEPWEVVYVNDGSKDTTLPRLLSHQAADPRVVVVELSRNWGHQPAITAGLQTARGQAVILMDGDFQDPPEVIREFVAAWRRGAQVVVAQRRSRQETGFRTWMYPVFYKVMGWLSDFPIPLNAGIFGLLDRQAVDSINGLSEGNRYLPGLRAWVGYPTEIVYYDRQDRAAGQPKQTFWKLLKYGLDAIFSFSYKPLRLSLVAGMVAIGFAVLWGIAMLMGLGPATAGLGSTLISVLLIGGVQLVGIGVLGEYIGRIYDEVKRRPLYLVRQVHQGRAMLQVVGGTEHERARERERIVA